MLKDITIGQYLPGTSLIHNLTRGQNCRRSHFYGGSFCCEKPAGLYPMGHLRFWLLFFWSAPIPSIKGLRWSWLLLFLLYLTFFLTPEQMFHKHLKITWEGILGVLWTEVGFSGTGHFLIDLDHLSHQR